MTVKVLQKKLKIAFFIEEANIKDYRCKKEDFRYQSENVFLIKEFPEALLPVCVVIEPRINTK